MTDRHLPPEALEDWLEGVSDLYDLGGDVDPDADVRVVLDVARDVARNVMRPAAPLTTFLLGLAVGRRVPDGEPVSAVLARLAQRVQDVALARPEAGEAGGPEETDGAGARLPGADGTVDQGTAGGAEAGKA